MIASGSKDNQQPVKLWDARTGSTLCTLHAHKNTVMDLAWNQVRSRSTKDFKKYSEVLLTPFLVPHLLSSFLKLS